MGIRPRRSTSSFIRRNLLRVGAGTVPVSIVTVAVHTTVENASKSIALAANQPVTWAKTGGADAAQFALIDATLNLPPRDFEAPQDAGGNNVYEVEVEATTLRGDQKARLTILVSVTNVAETPVLTRAPALLGLFANGANITYDRGDWTNGPALVADLLVDGVPQANTANGFVYSDVLHGGRALQLRVIPNGVTAAAVTSPVRIKAEAETLYAQDFEAAANGSDLAGFDGWAATDGDAGRFKLRGGFVTIEGGFSGSRHLKRIIGGGHDVTMELARTPGDAATTTVIRSIVASANAAGTTYLKLTVSNGTWRLFTHAAALNSAQGFADAITDATQIRMLRIGNRLQLYRDGVRFDGQANGGFDVSAVPSGEYVGIMQEADPDAAFTWPLNAYKSSAAGKLATGQIIIASVQQVSNGNNRAVRVTGTAVGVVSGLEGMILDGKRQIALNWAALAGLAGGAFDVTFANLPGNALGQDVEVLLRDPASPLVCAVPRNLYVNAPSVFNAEPAPSRYEGDSGTTAIVHVVTRTNGLEKADTVAWAVTPGAGSPVAASDFVGNVLPSGTANFAIGAATATAILNVAGDTTVEPDETYVFTISNPSSGAIGSAASVTGTIRNDDSGGAPAALTDTQAARFLSQSAMGGSIADIATAKQQGFAGWIDAQMALPRASSFTAWLTANGYAAGANEGTDQGWDDCIWSQLAGGTDLLRQRVGLALSEIIVVGVQGLQSYRQYMQAGFFDILWDNAFGNYRDILYAVSRNAAMSTWLTFNGASREVAGGAQPDENYAREIMQLFSIGLYQLNPDGSFVLANNKPVETYTNADIRGLARVFTGWVYDNQVAADPSFAARPVIAIASRHEPGAKTFLGRTIPAGTDAYDSIAQAIDIIFNHPNVGPFVGRQLIQRLVTSNPSPGYVGRVSAAFNDNGRGVRGDMRAVVRAVLLDAEARDDAVALASPSFGKLREPVMRLTAYLRGFGATSPTNVFAIGNTSDATSQLGQSPGRSPSVFNFFRPGYVPAATAIASGGLVAPEFQLENEESTTGYLNYMNARIAALPGNVTIDFTAIDALAVPDSGVMIDAMNLRLGAQLPAADRAAIKTAVDAMPDLGDGQANWNSRKRGCALMMILSSPSFINSK